MRSINRLDQRIMLQHFQRSHQLNGLSSSAFFLDGRIGSSLEQDFAEYFAGR